MNLLGTPQLVIAAKYATVGLSGTIIDLGLLFLLVEYAQWEVLPAATLSFICAVGNNFFWNKIWTFRDTSKRVVRQYIKFVIVSLIGLGLNTTFLFLFVHVLHIWYVAAKLITSGIIFLWNFTTNKLWTFRDYSIPRPPASRTHTIDVSIVVPAFNEEKNIDNTLASIMSFVAKLRGQSEVIIVNDGSTDATEEKVKAWTRAHTCITLLTLVKNRGKGAAVRAGMIHARGAIILFADADRSTPIEEFSKFLPAFNDGFDIVIGSRYLKDSTIRIKQPLGRILLGRLGNLLIQALLLDGIVDTQCGFKAFTYEAAHAIFPKQQINGWGFDMEVLAIGKQMKFKIKEIPVSWCDATDRASRLRPIRDAHRTLCDLLRIKFNLLTNRYW